MLHLTLDLNDDRLQIPTWKKCKLPLLYCMRCELAHWDFVYTVIDERRIEIDDYMPGDPVDGWEELGIGDEFPRQPVWLEPTPPEFQRLCEKLNRNEKLTPAEAESYCAVSGKRAIPEVGGYPVVDVVNQVGANAFLQQRVGNTQENDDTTYHLLAALCNDPRQGLKFGWDDYQILFWLHAESMRILVTHSA